MLMCDQFGDSATIVVYGQGQAKGNWSGIEWHDADWQAVMSCCIIVLIALLSTAAAAADAENMTGTRYLLLSV